TRRRDPVDRADRLGQRRGPPALARSRHRSSSRQARRPARPREPALDAARRASRERPALGQRFAYAYIVAMTPSTAARNTLCFTVKRNSFPSSERAMPVAATATARLVRLIILPMTPPAEFDAAMMAGSKPRLLAVTTCRLPNSALADVSLPVRNTPSQPTRALKNGNNAPVAANARPSV